jgi:hypothetical protein
MSRYVRAKPDAPDRRYNPRCVTNIRARAVLPGGGVERCLVRDVSRGGSRLVFAKPVALPPEFELVIGDSGRSRPVRLVWFEGRQAGVAKSSRSVTPANTP